MLHFTKSTSFSWIYQFSFLTECLRADENGFAGRICPAGRSSESLTLSKRSKTSLNDSTRRDHSIKIVLPHLLMLQKDFWSDAARIMRTQRILSITSPLHFSHVRYRLWRSSNNILNSCKIFTRLTTVLLTTIHWQNSFWFLSMRTLFVTTNNTWP